MNIDEKIELNKEASKTLKFLDYISCPYCESDEALDSTEDSYTCSSCSRVYPITSESIVELALHDELDDETKREMEGNHYPGSDDELKRQIVQQNIDIWEGYHWTRLKWEINELAKYLEEEPSGEFFVLGEGTARSLFLLSKYVDFDTLYCADISMSAVRQIPWRLASKNVTVGLFTSDLAASPISTSRGNEIPIIITYALHHLPDMEECMEKMMQKDHCRFYLIEPITNGFLSSLAKIKLSQRKEYSGVIPSRFNLKKLDRLCAQYGYEMEVKTNWKIPVDYYNKISRGNKLLESIAIKLVDMASLAGRPFNFGNGAVIKISKVKS